MSAFVLDEHVLSQAPADGQITPESALAQQITKGQAREIMQKYMPVPEATVRNHCSVLVNIGSKHKQMLMQASSQSLRCTLTEPKAHKGCLINACGFGICIYSVHAIPWSH